MQQTDCVVLWIRIFQERKEEREKEKEIKIRERKKKGGGKRKEKKTSFKNNFNVNNSPTRRQSLMGVPKIKATIFFY